MLLNKIYYHLKPIIPRILQVYFRRIVIIHKRKLFSDIWPIDKKANKQPNIWNGWPDGKKFALILTHDVETNNGQNQCKYLMDLELKLNFRSSFNFVPKRYNVSSSLRNELTSNGFEIGIHGLYHDGMLYSSSAVFDRRAKEINKYLKEWGAVGFKSPSMHRNLNWLHKLDIEYDSSTFDTDPFEPQPDGTGKIFPFWINGNIDHKGYIELPYTLPQDFTLFVLLKEKSITLWKQKLDWIAENGGMALLNTHPDYMNFDKSKCNFQEYPVTFYKNFLEYVVNKYNNQYWHVLPQDLAHFIKNSYLMNQKNPNK